MGSDDIIILNCDCGREIRARRSLAGQQVDCPVCGAVIYVPQEVRDVSAPPCPNCGRPWPAGEPRCPSCLVRTRTPQKKKKVDPAQRRISNHFEAIEDEGDLSDLSADLDSIAEESEDLPPAAPRRIAMPALARVWDSPPAQGWYLALTVLAGTALVCLLRGLCGDWLWLGAGVFYALVIAGMYFGWVAARRALFAGTIFGGLLLVAAAMAISPETVSYVAVLVLIGASVAALAGLARLTGRAETTRQVILGGSLLGGGLLIMMVAWGQSGLSLDSNGQGLLSSLRNVGKGAGDVFHGEAVRDMSDDLGQRSTQVAEKVQEIRAENEAEEEAEDTHTPPGDYAASPTSGTARALYESNEDRVAPPMDSMPSPNKASAAVAGDEGDPGEAVSLAAPNRQQWLALLSKRNLTPNYPVGGVFSSRSAPLKLSPVLGKVTLDCIFYEIEGSRLALMCSSPRPAEEAADADAMHRMLEWTAWSAAEYLGMKMENSLWRGERLMVRLAPLEDGEFNTGQLELSVIEGRILLAGGLFDRASVRQKSIVNAFLSSVRLPDAPNHE